MELMERPARLALEEILVITEFPPWADSAVPYALELAREHGARMQVTHAVPADVFDVKQKHRGVRITGGGSVRALAGGQMVAKESEIACQLQAVMESRHYDLVIASAGKPGEVELSEVAEELLQAARCPVLLLGPRVLPGSLLRPAPATILYATDFSPQALAAAQHAFSWAQEYESWLTMLHVVEDLPSDAVQDRDRVEEPFRKWMAEVVPEELHFWSEVEQRVMFGPAAPSIVSAAHELHSDLVVMGLSGFESAGHTGPGKTTLEVVRQAECPVLVVQEYMTKHALLEIAREQRSHAIAAAA